MTLEIERNHEAKGLLSLVPPMWGKPRIAAWLVSYLAEVQALEDALWTFLDGIDVDTCARFELVQLAALVGERTSPESTEVLRVRVKGRIAANRSSGTAADLCHVAEILAGPGRFLQAAGVVRVLADPFDDLEQAQAAAALLQAAALGGVRAVWVERGTFSFPDIDDADPDATHALGTGSWSSVA